MVLIAVLILPAHGAQDLRNAPPWKNAAMKFGAPRTTNAYLLMFHAVIHPRAPAQIEMEP